jgi:hypothetical protein
MRIVAALLVFAASPVLAGPVPAGVGLGLTAASPDATTMAPPTDRTYSLFGRYAFTSRLAGQIEVQRVAEIRSASALLVVELGASGHLVPLLVAGAGADRADNLVGTTTGHHVEGGLGLEYRADGGIAIGADVRMGGRSIDSQPLLETFAACDPGCPANAYQAGEYRSARAYVGVRF